MDVLERDYNALIGRYIDARDTSQFSYSLRPSAAAPARSSGMAVSRCSSVALSPETATNVKRRRLPALAARHRRSISNWVFVVAINGFLLVSSTSARDFLYNHGYRRRVAALPLRFTPAVLRAGRNFLRAGALFADFFPFLDTGLRAVRGLTSLAARRAFAAPRAFTRGARAAGTALGAFGPVRLARLAGYPPWPAEPRRTSPCRLPRSRPGSAPFRRPSAARPAAGNRR